MYNPKNADGSDTIQSYDDTEILTNVGFYKTLFRLYWNTRKICIPAIVTEVFDGDGKVRVKPLVNLSKSTEKGRVGIERSEVDVWPIQFLHGGFIIRAPLFPGDTGYLVAGDRFSDNATSANNKIVYKKCGERNIVTRIVRWTIQAYHKIMREEKTPYNDGPVNLGMFNTNEWEYGFFIPSSWADDKVNENFKDKLVIGNVQKKDRSAYITIDADGDVVIHGLKINIKGDVTIEGASKFLASDGEYAELKETKFLVGYDKKDNKLKEWRGEIVRTDGEIHEIDGFEGMGEVTFFGNTGSATQAKGNKFTFKSASDSNVKIECDGTNITVGVYYL